MEKTIEVAQEEINQIEVKESALICGSVTRVCDPEDMFDVVEQCKICKRWI